MIGTRLTAAVALAVALGVLGGLAYVAYSAPGAVSQAPPKVRAAATPSGEPVLITIEQGESARSIGKALKDAGIIDSSRHFELMVGLTGVQDSLEAGEYEFDPGIPVIEAVRRIAEGRTAAQRVVIREGLRAEEIGDVLQAAGICGKQAFLLALQKSGYSQPFLAQVTSDSVEGFLFPAVYDFRRNTPPEDVVNRLLDAFQANVADKIQLEGQPYTLEEVVSLASIVEREAGVASERPLIASVYENRLRSGIALQADPTVQFAVAQDPSSAAQYGYWKKELTVDDLALDSPYNTYVYQGLPPGPIANPGLDAIEAVIRPAQTDYLYFVAKGDGTHAFAETLEEHLANIERYR